MHLVLHLHCPQTAVMVSSLNASSMCCVMFREPAPWCGFFLALIALCFSSLYKPLIEKSCHIPSMMIVPDAEVSACCVTTDWQRAPAALAACAARRWLARNAAGTKVLRRDPGTFYDCMDIPAYISLVSCLPALEDVRLCLPETLVPDDVGCLLEALACLPRLRALDLWVDERCGVAWDTFESDAVPPCPDTSAFTKLRSLTKLRLSVGEAHSYTVAGVVGALVSLTGLAELSLCLPRSKTVPAALGQLKGLRSLVLSQSNFCDFEAGCLELPNLLSLEFAGCSFPDAERLPCVTALQNLASIKLLYGPGPRFFDHQLVQLPRLQQIIFEPCEPSGGTACPWLSRPPADMGFLKSSLLHLSFHWAGLTQFPVALTQLVALEHLNASGNDFAEVPAAITSLSRLTELVLGRCAHSENLCRPLNARALKDLSGFPVLCRLTFYFSEVVFCESLPGAGRHAKLASITFTSSHPAPECAPMVLQLSQALRRLKRGSVLSCEYEMYRRHAEHALQSAHALAPHHKFQVALQAYGM